MAWTDSNPVVIGNATKKSDYDAAFDNSKYLRDSVGDFSIIPAGTGAGGTVSAPSHTFRDDLNTGMYHISSDRIGIACGGVKILDILSTGATITGIITGTSLVLSGAISGATTINASGAITGASLALSGAITGATTIGASGAISGGSLSVSGQVSGASLLLTGASITVGGIITGASLALAGAISGATTITGSGNITGSGFVMAGDADTYISTSGANTIVIVAGATTSAVIKSTALLTGVGADDTTGAWLQSGSGLSISTTPPGGTGKAGRIFIPGNTYSAVTTSNGTVKTGTTSVASSGWLAIWIETTPYYIPYWPVDALD